MKFRKILSAVTALAMSASAVAGLAVTANAESTTSTLYPTAGWCAGASESGITAASFTATADATVLNFFNNATNWSCQGVALLQFTLPQLDDGEKVFSATLTSQARVTSGTSIDGYSDKGRTYDIYQMPTEPDVSEYSLESIDDSTTVVSALNLSNKVATGCYAIQNSSSYYAQTTDVTDEVVAQISSNGTTTITFAYTNIDKIGYLNAATSTLAVTYGTGYDYTVNYYLDDIAEANLVATDNSGNTDSASVTISKDTVVWGTVDDYTDNKYYVSADATLTIDTEDTTNNVLSVVVRAAETYDVVINATGDITKSAISSASIIEGEDDYVYYPRYIYDENAAIVYETSPEDKYAYRISYTDMADDDTVDLTYSKAYENVVYFEDIDESDDANSQVPSYASNGLARNAAAWSSDTLQPGTYQIAVMACRRYRHSLIKVGETTLFDIDNSGLDSKPGYWGLLTTTFTIDEAATVELVTSGTTYDPIDTIIITQSPVLTAAATESGDTDDSTVSAPTITGNVTEANGTAKFDYDTLVESGGNVVKTIYVKVINPDDDTTPTITINGDVYTPVWQPVTGTSASYYFAQFIGAASGFGNTITIGYGELSESVELGE